MGPSRPGSATNRTVGSYETLLLAEHGEHAAGAGELEALPPRGCAESAEQHLAGRIKQGPAIAGGTQPETVGRTVAEPDVCVQLERGSGVSCRGHSRDCRRYA